MSYVSDKGKNSLLSGYVFSCFGDHGKQIVGMCQTVLGHGTSSNHKLPVMMGYDPVMCLDLLKIALACSSLQDK